MQGFWNPYLGGAKYDPRKSNFLLVKCYPKNYIHMGCVGLHGGYMWGMFVCKKHQHVTASPEKIGNFFLG